MPNLDDIVQKNDDGTVSVTLTDGRVAIVGDLPATKQFTVDSAAVSELMDMRAMFATVRIGDHEVKIKTAIDYGKTLDVLGDSINLTRISGAFAFNFTELEDASTFTDDGPDGTAVVQMVEGGTATIRKLTARQLSIAHALSPESAGMIPGETEALCGVVEVNGTAVKVNARKDLNTVLELLVSGRNLDRVSRAYAFKFKEELNLPNS